MYLKKIGIVNYRSLRDLILELSKDLPNTFIGRTDAGKTSILKAIGLLLDEKNFPVLLREGQEASDISTTLITPERYEEIFKSLNMPVFEPSLKESIVIVGVFSKEDADFDDEFDQVSSDHLKWSIESISSDEIVLVREFSQEYPMGRYFLLTKDSLDKNKQLWKENQTTLTKLIKESNITDSDITNDNKTGRFKNIEKFRALYNRMEKSDSWSPYSDFKKDKTFFPIYRYIDWKEITLKGVEALAQDTMSGIIDDYSSKLRTTAEELSREATEKVNDQINEKIKEIISGLPSVVSIKAKVHFESSGIISEIVVVKGTSDGEVRLESQGDGVKKQIGFAFMRLGALDGVSPEFKRKKFIWAFDEPEVHLYPAEKREFYDIIKNLSKNIFQTVISTHSTVFVDKSRLDTIRQVQLVDKYTTVSMCSSVSDVHNSLGIKNSDFLFYDIFIGAEGSSDSILIPHFYNLYFERDIKEDSIQVIDLGGESFWKTNKQILEKILGDFKNPEDSLFCVLDADTRDTGKNTFLIGKFDLEDSIEDKYWKILVKDKCGVVLDDKDFEDIRNKMSVDSNSKFHELLKRRIADIESRTNYLPSKRDCASFMKDYIKDKSGIPEDFIRLFKKLEEIGK